MPPRQNKRPEGPRRNREIRVPRVLLIDETGRKLGTFETRDALRIAQERGLDLVEVSPNARPPVCKILDYGRMKYEQSKKAREQRKNSTDNTPREIKFRPATEQHDFDTKTRKIREFIDKGSRVRVVVRFRRREMRRREVGQDQMKKIVEAVSDIAKVDGRVSWQGNAYVVMLVPNERGDG